MGREVKRVPVDFDWPLGEVWQGFLMPDRLDEQHCSTCAVPTSWYGQEPRGDGLTPEARAINDTFYAHMIGGPRAEALAWGDKIGQAEVDHLVAEGRLDHGRLFDRVDLPEPHEISEWGSPIRYAWVRNEVSAPTADEVNASQRRPGLGSHDAINRMILVRFRCDRLKTTSEGSPISPVFATAEGLADWLTTIDGGNAVAFGGRGAPMTASQARGFVGGGWAPSMIGNAGGVHDGASFVGAAAVLRDHGDGAV